MSPCPPSEVLQRLLDGELPEAQRAVVREHLAGCAPCHSLLDRLSDDAELRRWANACEPPLLSAEDGYAPLLDKLRAVFLDTPGSASTVPHDGPSRFFDPPQQPGELGTFGPYRVLSLLGRGAMGVVYQARHVTLDRDVALKMIRDGALASQEQRLLFLAEARAAARLQHPNIVQIFEVGEHDGRPFIALEYVNGGSLADRLDGTPLPARAAAALVETLARAVHYAHQRGVVHRDLKPANILLQKNSTEANEGNQERQQGAGQGHPSSSSSFSSFPSVPSLIPKVADFGVAKLLDVATGFTRTGAVLGTPNYMAPEQAAGRAREVGPAADIHALGAILYELLTGRPPFQAASTGDLLDQVRFQEPVPPRRLQPKLPRDLDTICLKCLQKEAPRRYASAEALADDLRRFQAGEPIRARRTGPAGRLWRWCRRRPLVAGLAAAAALVFVAIAAVVWYVRKADHADALVARLLAAETAQVPAIVKELDGYHYWADPKLREVLVRPSSSPKEQLHARLALLPVGPDQADDLVDDLLRADPPNRRSTPQEVLVIRAALRPHRERLTGRLWQQAEGPEGSTDQRFRAACALADFDPDSRRWAKISPAVAASLVAENPLLLGSWMEALRPVRLRLLKPLGDSFRDKDNAVARSLAATVLADYAFDQADVLTDLLLDADDGQFAVLWPKLEEHRQRAVALMIQELGKTADTEQDKDKLARRQAQAAVALLQFGEAGPVWPLLVHGPDPRVRTELIHRFRPLKADPAVLARRLDEEPDVSARRALILSLGEFPADRLPEKIRGPLVKHLLTLYQKDPDPGVHSAAEWLLRRWERGEDLREIDRGLASGGPPGGRRWYVSKKGHTLVVIPEPGEFTVGSWGPEQDRRDNRVLHQVRVARSFAVASKEVTLAQFQCFLKEYPEVKHRFTKGRSAGPEGPALSVTWFQAVMYCRWLSEREGIAEEEMCYPPVQDILRSLDEGTPLRLPANYLTRTGYRLPTEAEWEYACRAGAITRRFFGDADVLLRKYAWHLLNAEMRTQLVGLLKPNDYGLFDIQGNVSEWCQDRERKDEAVAQVRDDVEDPAEVTAAAKRVLRGSGFNSMPPDTGSASRILRWPDEENYDSVGFRVVRTYRSP